MGCAASRAPSREQPVSSSHTLEAFRELRAPLAVSKHDGQDGKRVGSKQDANPAEEPEDGEPSSSSSRRLSIQASRLSGSRLSVEAGSSYEGAPAVDVAVLRRCRAFESASAEQLVALAALLSVEPVAVNTLLYREGEPDSKLYVLASGLAVVTTMDARGFPVEVGRISTCSAFGESSLFEEQYRRHTSVSTLEPCVLYSLKKKQLARFARALPEVVRELEFNAKRREAMKLALKSIDVFNRISIDKWQVLLELCSMRKYAAGDVVVQEGDQDSGKFYIIASGALDVFVGGAKVRTLERNSYFGEVSLLSDRAHSATVAVNGGGGSSRNNTKAANKVAVLLEVRKGGFLRLLEEEDSLLSEFRMRIAGHNCLLHDVLHHELGRSFLEKKLAKEFSIENIQFWLAADAFEAARKSLIRKSVLRSLGIDPQAMKAFKHELRLKNAQRIYGDFLAPSASKPINVPGSVADEIKARIEAGDAAFDLFAKAKANIFTLLHDDAWPRFQRSAEFTEMLQALGAYDLNINMSATLKRGLGGAVPMAPASPRHARAQEPRAARAPKRVDSYIDTVISICEDEEEDKE
jgi:CRP-like cAMP-binding protein